MRNLVMGSPYSGANAMTLELAGYHSSELSFTIWALGWSLGYSMGAAVLLGIAIAAFDPRRGRAAIGGYRRARMRALPPHPRHTAVAMSDRASERGLDAG